MDSIRYPIRLEKWVTSKDGNGNNIEEITEKINVFANVKRLSGFRASLNGVTHLDNLYQFIFRFTPKYDLAANWRIIYAGNIFTIKSDEKYKEERFYRAVKAESKGKKKVIDNFILTEDSEVILTEDSIGLINE